LYKIRWLTHFRTFGNLDFNCFAECEDMSELVQVMLDRDLAELYEVETCSSATQRIVLIDNYVDESVFCGRKVSIMPRISCVNSCSK